MVALADAVAGVINVWIISMRSTFSLGPHADYQFHSTLEISSESIPEAVDLSLSILIHDRLAGGRRFGFGFKYT